MKHTPLTLHRPGAESETEKIRKQEAEAMQALAEKIGYKPIENYGAIGDLHSVALVATDGSIDWCCLPHFDSPSVFAALLDSKKGGRFKVSPADPAVERQLYIPGTCILLTRFLCPHGIGELVDFMTIEEGVPEARHRHEIVRMVKVVKGRMRFKLECLPAFDYARAAHEVHIRKEGALFRWENGLLILSSSVPLSASGAAAAADFTLDCGQEAVFVLRYAAGEGAEAPPAVCEARAAFDATVRFWRRWNSRITYQGRWREVVQRSAMTLKLLTFQPTGAVVAAPTTSLPEKLGGTRNFDYRYTWIRDAAFTVYAFIRLGLTQEAEHFLEWIDARVHEEKADQSLQLIYSVHGEHRLEEVELHHLEGYRGSYPVRIGNQAYSQLQLDIYGELMDAVYLSNKYGKPISYDIWTHLRAILEYVCENWSRKDEGIWEVRGGRHHFVFSKLMCWVALDRGIRLAGKRSFPANLGKWTAVRDEIYEEVMRRGWNEEKGHFVQHYETDALDASNLIMPLTFFISPNDPRMKSTLDATLRSLAQDSLVRRYDGLNAAWDGFEKEEGSFSMCTFWLVECLTRAGRLDEARLIFEKMHSYANHLGLYSEQVGPTGELLGNFPQALTHLSLISAAVNLDRALNQPT